jgi:hypothetical protein
LNVKWFLTVFLSLIVLMLCAVQGGSSSKNDLQNLFSKLHAKDEAEFNCD